ncbi:hypothetical protein DENSPDRAFT_832549 [Dentipellis sp. KUC8613]|nr:hypothetical protein DENSPDRAFT_832549 [Dentipellis sp. KUC8613]
MQPKAQTLSLPDLPNDLLFIIFLCLPLTEILALRQTCRTLHNVGSTDYVWHHIAKNTPLPLNIPLGVDPAALNAHELRKIVIRAWKLDRNWRKPTPDIIKYTPIIYGSGQLAINSMHFLPGAQWLVTAQRYHRVGIPRTAINLWCLEDLDAPYRSSSADTAGHFLHFSVAQRKDSNIVSVAVTTDAGNRNTIQIHNLHVRNRSESELFQFANEEPHQVISSSARGFIDEIAMHDNLTAATFYDVNAEPADHRYKVLLVNMTSWHQILFEPVVTERSVQQVSLRLTADAMLLVSFAFGGVTIRSYPLSDIFQGGKGTPAQQRPGHRPSGSQNFRHSYIPWAFNVREVSPSDIVISSAKGPTYLSYFCLCFSATGIDGEVARLSLTDDKLSLEECGRFTVPTTNHASIIRVGPTGRRAVWIERNWDTDQTRLMKSYLPSEDTSSFNAGILLPPNPGLPFTPQLCHSIAFDEVVGRMCLGLITGDLWVLDFV